MKAKRVHRPDPNTPRAPSGPERIKVPTAGSAPGQVGENFFQGKAPSSEVPSVFCRFSAEKGTENMIFIKHLFKNHEKGSQMVLSRR